MKAENSGVLSGRGEEPMRSALDALAQAMRALARARAEVRRRLSSR